MKPTPVPVNTVCSVCGLPWEGHGDDPTEEKCVELLKAEVSRLKDKPGPAGLPNIYPWGTTPNWWRNPGTFQPIVTYCGTSSTVASAVTESLKKSAA